jgi:hypothetical protein
MDETQLVSWLRSTVPSCLSNAKVTPAQLPEPFDNNPCSIWQIACRCGDTNGRFLGYSLRNYNTDYDGPECFLSPLAFECSACQIVTELLDTDRHGYHVEVTRLEGDETGSSKLRGEGPRTAFCCPGCGSEVFSVIVGFVFWYPDELCEEVDERWEDFFSVFLSHCKCVGCGKTSQPTDFGKL